MKTKILFWPGIGKDLNVLKEFVEELKLDGNEIEYFKEDYDVGEMNPSSWNQVINNDCDWWIGISLGASLLYYAYSYVPIKKRPTRITLINPFYSRRILSYEKKFNINEYWEFNPIDKKNKIKHCELLISIFDKNINPYHGLTLSTSINSNNKNLMLVNSDHTLKLNNVQRKVADILLSYNKRGCKYEKKYNGCHIYKQ